MKLSSKKDKTSRFSFNCSKLTMAFGPLTQMFSKQRNNLTNQKLQQREGILLLSNWPVVNSCTTNENQVSGLLLEPLKTKYANSLAQFLHYGSSLHQYVGTHVLLYPCFVSIELCYLNFRLLLLVML
jgi:hypothetical protein